MSSVGREKERLSRRRESMSDSTILGDPACSLELERHRLLVWIRLDSGRVGVEVGEGEG